MVLLRSTEKINKVIIKVRNLKKLIKFCQPIKETEVIYINPYRQADLVRNIVRIPMKNIIWLMFGEILKDYPFLRKLKEYFIRTIQIMLVIRLFIALCFFLP